MIPQSPSLEAESQRSGVDRGASFWALSAVTLAIPWLVEASPGSLPLSSPDTLLVCVCPVVLFR